MVEQLLQEHLAALADSAVPLPTTMLAEAYLASQQRRSQPLALVQLGADYSEAMLEEASVSPATRPSALSVDLRT